MSRFSNRVALATGGGTGIGRAITKAMVAEGYKVVVNGSREEPLKQLAAEHPDAVRYVTTDVTEKGAPAAAMAFVVEQFDRLESWSTARVSVPWHHSSHSTMTPWNRRWR
jgi:NADP-dependent 3-hydroxy acid dehydrogenase YdfG